MKLKDSKWYGQIMWKNVSTVTPFVYVWKYVSIWNRVSIILKRVFSDPRRRILVYNCLLLVIRGHKSSEIWTFRSCLSFVHFVFLNILINYLNNKRHSFVFCKFGSRFARDHFLIRNYDLLRKKKSYFFKSQAFP